MLSHYYQDYQDPALGGPRKRNAVQDFVTLEVYLEQAIAQRRDNYMLRYLLGDLPIAYGGKPAHRQFPGAEHRRPSLTTAHLERGKRILAGMDLVLVTERLSHDACLLQHAGFGMVPLRSARRSGPAHATWRHNTAGQRQPHAGQPAASPPVSEYSARQAARAQAAARRAHFPGPAALQVRGQTQGAPPARVRVRHGMVWLTGTQGRAPGIARGLAQAQLLVLGLPSDHCRQEARGAGGHTESESTSTINCNCNDAGRAIATPARCGHPRAIATSCPAAETARDPSLVLSRAPWRSSSGFL